MLTGYHRSTVYADGCHTLTYARPYDTPPA